MSAMMSRAGEGFDGEGPWMPPDGQPHFPPKAKSVIWIFLCGGLSHVESFDVKPALNQYAGKSIDATPFASVVKDFEREIVGGNPNHGNRKVLMPLQTGYKAYGQSGLGSRMSARVPMTWRWCDRSGPRTMTTAPN
jgi:Protein of unknown function (DUF1501)